MSAERTGAGKWMKVLEGSGSSLLAQGSGSEVLLTFGILISGIRT